MVAAQGAVVNRHLAAVSDAATTTRRAVVWPNAAGVDLDLAIQIGDAATAAVGAIACPVVAYYNGVQNQFGLGRFCKHIVRQIALN